MQPSVVVLVPAHNEQSTVGQVVRDASAQLACEVVVIDDASEDATRLAARAAGATVLPLASQLGAWGAIQTGMRYALNSGYDTAITMDADGQHPVSSVDLLLASIQQGNADVVIGACPQRASRARRIAWGYFRLLTGLRLEDITSGFRIYNRAAMSALAAPNASLLDYQDVGVLMILQRGKLRTDEVYVQMSDRSAGGSRVFSSWWVVAKYMMQTTLLCLAGVGKTQQTATR
jgi:glycosyltransferase involved in cell wall biosynthesis